MTQKYSNNNLRRTCPICSGKGYIYNEIALEIIWVEDMEQVFEICPRCFGVRTIPDENRLNAVASNDLMI